MINERSEHGKDQKQEVQKAHTCEGTPADISSGLKQHDKRIERRVLLFLLTLGIVYTLYIARDFLLPVSVALLLSFVLQPLVRGLEWLKLPAALAAGIVIILSAALVGTAVYHLSSPATEWIHRGPILRKQLELKFYKIRHSLKEAQETTDKLEELAELESKKTPEVVVKDPTLRSRIFAQTQTTIVALMVVVILTYFLLWRGQTTLTRMVKSFSGSRQSEAWTDILVHIERQIALYLQTITMINCVLGTATAGAMALLGMPTPILWGVVAGFFNFLPYIGAGVTACIIGIVSALTFDAWYRIALPPFTFAVLTVLEGQIITPTILGNHLNIDPILVFTSVLFWGWLWGVAGALLAVPVLAVLKIIFSNVESLKRYEQLFG